MARLGAFDATLLQLALFDDSLLIEGWFSKDLIDAPATSASLTPVLGALLLAGTSPARVGGAIVVPLTP